MNTNTYQVYQRLLHELGPQAWWPAESAFEVMVGAVLVQNTAWKNVERAIENLKDAQLLTPRKLHAVVPEKLETLIRPAGYFRLKTKRLKSLVEFVMQEYQGSMKVMQKADTELLREQLLNVYGVGPETADSILLYALDKPAMVVDTYTKRIFTRHGWVEHPINYHQLQQHLVHEVPSEVKLYNELHAQLVYLGHHYCKPIPKCENCPLEDMLPCGGIVELAE